MRWKIGRQRKQVSPIPGKDRGALRKHFGAKCRHWGLVLKPHGKYNMKQVLEEELAFI